MNFKEKLIIIGASGHGKVVADIAMKMSKWNRVAFLDDNEQIKESMGIPVLGRTSDAIQYKDESDFFVAIGNNVIRENVQDKLTKDGLNIVTLIHPSAVIGTDVEIGVGTVIMASVVINSSSAIGKGCIINTGSSIDHDNSIEDFVHISPGARTAGNVQIGKKTWLGIGSLVSNNLIICSDCKIGAGAVVVNDIIEPGTYVGVPVRKIE